MQIVPCESASKEVPFECSLCRILSRLKSLNFIQNKTVPCQPPPQALRFPHGRGERETRVTGDEPQGTMGRVQAARTSKERRLEPKVTYSLLKRVRGMYRAKVLLKRFHFNGHIVGFHP